MTGAVNIITKPPRDSVGTTASMERRLDRPGRRVNRPAGPGDDVRHQRDDHPGATDRLAYRISAGYFQSDRFRARRAGPVIEDPRLEGATVGGAPYPLDGSGPFGAAFAYRGTSQPKFDVRVDQELSNGGQFSYSGGVAATEGLSRAFRHPARIVRGVRQARLYAGRLPVPGLHQHHGRRRAEPPAARPQQPRPAKCSCGSRARRSTPRSAPPRSSANATCRPTAATCAGTSSTSPLPRRRPNVSSSAPCRPST